MFDDEPQDEQFYTKGGYSSMEAALATFMRDRQRRAGSLVRIGIRHGWEPVEAGAHPLRRPLGDATPFDTDANPFTRRTR
ncbi:hypothetical protein BH24CHL7_BH24CHL7_06710 [soil metagenome]